MQAAARITGKLPGSPHHLPDREKHPNRNRPKEKNYGASVRRNDFLNTALSPIAPTCVIRDEYKVNYNYITQENYHFLRDSYFHYAELLGVKVLHKVGKTVGQSIANLYDEMNILTGDDIELNIETCEEKLCFVLWKTHQWGKYTLYWFPVKFVEKLPSQLRRIIISFLHQLIRSNGLATMNNEYDSEMVLDWIEEMSYERGKKEVDKIHALVKSYREGKIYRLLARVETKCYYKRLSTAIENILRRMSSSVLC